MKKYLFVFFLLSVLAVNGQSSPLDKDFKSRFDNINRQWIKAKKKSDTIRIKKDIEEIIEDADEIDLRVMHITAKRCLAVWHERMKDSLTADSIYSKVLDDCKLFKEPKEYAKTLDSMSRFYQRLNNYRKAIDYGIQYDSLSKDLKLEGKGLLFGNMAGAYRQIHQLDSALLWRKRAITAFTEKNDSLSAARQMSYAIYDYALMTSGSVVCQNPKYAHEMAINAQLLLNRILQITQNVKKSQKEEALFIKASAYHNYKCIVSIETANRLSKWYSNFDTAIAYCQLAIEAYKKTDNYTLNAPSLAWDNAIFFLQKAIIAADETSKDSLKSNTLECEAWYYDARYKIRKAHYYLGDSSIYWAKKGLEIVKKSKNTEGVSDVEKNLWHHLALTYYAMDSLDKAAFYWGLINDTYTRGNLNSTYAWNIKKVLEEKKDYNAVIELGQKILAVDDVGYSILSEGYWKKGQVQEAINYMKIFIDKSEIGFNKERNLTYGWDKLAYYYKYIQPYNETNKGYKAAKEDIKAILNNTTYDKAYFWYYLYHLELNCNCSFTDTAKIYWAECRNASFKEKNFHYLPSLIEYRNDDEEFNAKKELVHFYEENKDTIFNNGIDYGIIKMFALYFETIGKNDSAALYYEKLIQSDYFNENMKHRRKAITYYHFLGKTEKVFELSDTVVNELVRQHQAITTGEWPFPNTNVFPVQNNAKTKNDPSNTIPSMENQDRWYYRKKSISTPLITFKSTITFDELMLQYDQLELDTLPMYDAVEKDPDGEDSDDVYDLKTTNKQEKQVVFISQLDNKSVIAHLNANVKFKNKQIDKAIQVYEIAIKNGFPEETENKYVDSIRGVNALYIADYYYKNGKFTQAEEQYENAILVFDNMGKMNLVNSVRKKIIDILYLRFNERLQNKQFIHEKIKKNILKLGDEFHLEETYLEKLFNINSLMRDFSIDPDKAFGIYNYLKANKSKLLTHPYVKNALMAKYHENELSIKNTILAKTQLSNEELKVSENKLTASVWELRIKEQDLADTNYLLNITKDSLQLLIKKEKLISSKLRLYTYSAIILGLVLLGVIYFLRRQIKKNNFLQEELVHRIVNNLKNTIANISSYKRRKSIEVKTELNRVEEKLSGMLVVQDLLFSKKDIQLLEPVKDYIVHLALTILTHQDIKFDTEGIKYNEHFSWKVMCNLGIICSELLTNSIKYAFKGTISPQISISLEKIGNHKFMMIYKDNGIGLPQNFDNKPTLGMKILKNSVMTLQGTIEPIMDSDTEGAIFKIIFSSNV